MELLLEWIDGVWLLVALIAVHKGHRIIALCFVASCMLMLRLQTETMVSMGHIHGLFNVWDLDVFTRGLGTYAVFYLLYFLLARFSSGSQPIVFMGASISIFFTALFVSSLVMLL